ncbi:MAG: polysaccharide biosynthesis tyrosine autokinase [Bacteroidia bacterium]
MNDTDFIRHQEEDKINVKEILIKYLRYWPFYILGIAMALFVAKIQLRYAPTIFSSSTTIKIIDDSKNADIDLAVLPPGANLFNKGVNLYNEIEIIKSKRLLAKMVIENQMETFYYSKGKVQSSEVWGTSQPFIINWHKSDTFKELSASPMFGVLFTSANTYNLLRKGEVIKKDLNIGSKVAVSSFSFTLNKMPGHNYKAKYKNETLFSFQYKTPLQRAASLSKQLGISFVNKNSDILALSLSGPNANKSRYVLDKIVQYFNEDSQEDKRQVSKKTKEFVDSRIDALIQDLNTIETDLVNYKQRESYYKEEWFLQKYSSRESESYAEENNLQTQLLLIRSMIKNLEVSDTFELLPVDFGLADAGINTLIVDFNELVLLREKFLMVSTIRHPEVVLLRSKIINSKSNLSRSLIQLEQSVADKVSKIASTQISAERQLSTIPAKEKALRSILRQQSIKENLYLFLLEKRETAALNSEVIAPSVKVVDYAYTNPGPVSPNKKAKYIVAFFIGLIIPIGLVYLKHLFDTKVHSKEDITKNVGPNIPIVGEIPLIDKSSNWLISENDRSELAEAFRVVRTNINYLMPTRLADISKVIIVTSSTKSEGKTFASLNTALSLASGNHKVLLVGADLRNPQLHHAFEMDKNTAGLTTYLHDTDCQLESLIQKEVLGFESLDVVLSGFIPPNPAELLLNGRFETFLNEVKENYEYVIIDSAPTILVTDTLLLSKYANVCLYLVRSGVTDIKILEHLSDLVMNNKLPHLGVLLNGVGRSGSYGYKYKYNYGYGYTYHADVAERRSWWKRVFLFWKK